MTKYISFKIFDTEDHPDNWDAIKDKQIKKYYTVVCSRRWRSWPARPRPPLPPEGRGSRAGGHTCLLLRSGGVGRSAVLSRAGATSAEGDGREGEEERRPAQEDRARGGGLLHEPLLDAGGLRGAAAHPRPRRADRGARRRLPARRRSHRARSRRLDRDRRPYEVRVHLRPRRHGLPDDPHRRGSRLPLATQR